MDGLFAREPNYSSGEICPAFPFGSISILTQRGPLDSLAFIRQSVFILNCGWAGISTRAGMVVFSMSIRGASDEGMKSISRLGTLGKVIYGFNIFGANLDRPAITMSLFINKLN